MSDETKIEGEDTEDTEDVEAHAGRVASRVVSQVRNAGEEGDDDVQAHIRLS